MITAGWPLRGSKGKKYKNTKKIMNGDGMHQTCIMGKSVDHGHIFSVYTGKIRVLSADSLSVQSWCIPSQDCLKCIKIGMSIYSSYIHSGNNLQLLDSKEQAV